MEIALSAGLDIVIIAVFVTCIILATRRGFFKTIIAFCGNIVALIVALTFCTSLGSHITTNYVREPIQQWFISSLTPTADAAAASIDDLDFDHLFNDNPNFFKETTDFLGINTVEMAEKYQNLKENGVDQAKAAIVDAMTTPVSSIIGKTIAFILLFVGSIIIVKVLWLLSSLVVNLPVIRSIDRIGGVILGVINGILITFVLVAVINIGLVYALKDKPANQRENIIENTFIFKFVDEINPLRKIFDK